MKNRIYIKSKLKNELLGVFNLTSEKYFFLLAVTELSSLNKGEDIFISNDNLKMGIRILLSNRNNKGLIDFGNRFENEKCYETLSFDNQQYVLETSGYDNLIIFAIKLLDSEEEFFVLTDEL